VAPGNRRSPRPACPLRQTRRAIHVRTGEVHQVGTLLVRTHQIGQRQVLRIATTQTNQQGSNAFGGDRARDTGRGRRQRQLPSRVGQHVGDSVRPPEPASVVHHQHAPLTSWSGRPVGQDVDPANGRRSKALDIEVDRCGAGREDCDIEVAIKVLRAGDPRFQLDGNAEPADLGLQVIQQATKAGALGKGRRQEELTAKAIACFEQGHVVSPQRRDARGLHARRSAADHRHPARRLRGGKFGEDRILFASDLRVHRAVKVRRKGSAVLIEADARSDAIFLPTRGLVHPLPVGDESAGKADRIGLAVTQDFLRDGRRSHALAGDRDQAGRFAQDPRSARRGRCRLRHVLHVSAARAQRDTDVVGRRALGERRHDPPAIRDLQPTDDLFIGAQAQPQHEIVTAGMADRIHDFEQEAHALLGRTAIRIVAVVGCG
jgi:hypothetical protein